MSEDNSEIQLKPEHLNMIVLDYLVKNPRDFYNSNEIKEKAASTRKKTLHGGKVGKALNYFLKKGYIQEFSTVDNLSQKEAKKRKEIRSDSYQITDAGKEVYDKIKNSCLDPVGQIMLGSEKL